MRRRRFLAGIAASAVAALRGSARAWARAAPGPSVSPDAAAGGAPAIRTSSTAAYDVAIVGAGLFGSAAARHLSAHAEGVALIGPGEPADHRAHTGVFASHHDASRLVRIVDPDLLWATLAQRSIRRFRRLEQDSGVDFFREVGYLMVTPGGLGTDWFDFPAMRTVAGDLSVGLETLDGDDLARRFGALRFTAGSAGLLQPEAAGYVDPRRLLEAQQTVAASQGVTRLTDEVVELRPASGNVELRTRDGRRVLADRVIVATGASTNACELLGRRLAATIRAAMIMLAEVGSDVALRVPATLYAKTDGAVPFWGLLMPPVRYPDGRTYVKTMDDHYGDQPLETYDDIGGWCRGDGHVGHARVLRRALAEVAPGLEVGAAHLRPCLIADTATGYPYVDRVDERIVVATGGNGKAAKSSDEIGRLAAELVRTGEWPGGLPAAPFAAQFVD